jgi:hypothetical protein
VKSKENSKSSEKTVTDRHTKPEEKAFSLLEAELCKFQVEENSCKKQLRKFSELRTIVANIFLDPTFSSGLRLKRIQHN